MGGKARKEAERAARVAAVLRAVADYDLTQSPAWAELDALSTHTYVDDVEVDPEGIVFDGDDFRGSMNVYVLLQYGKDAEEGFKTSDSFRGAFAGSFAGDDAVIETVEVNTLPFYEGEAG